MSPVSKFTVTSLRFTELKNSGEEYSLEDLFTDTKDGVSRHNGWFMHDRNSNCLNVGIPISSSPSFPNPQMLMGFVSEDRWGLTFPLPGGAFINGVFTINKDGISVTIDAKPYEIIIDEKRYNITSEKIKESIEKFLNGK